MPRDGGNVDVHSPVGGDIKPDDTQVGPVVHLHDSYRFASRNPPTVVVLLIVHQPVHPITHTTGKEVQRRGAQPTFMNLVYRNRHPCGEVCSRRYIGVDTSSQTPLLH